MKNKGDWLLLLAAAIGGGGFISLKYLLDWGYSPYHIIFGRFLVAACGMGLFYFRQIPQIRRRAGGDACGNGPAADDGPAIYHAVGQCVSVEYSGGHCAVPLLGHFPQKA